MKKYSILVALVIMCLAACTPSATEPVEEADYGNPAAEGFNEAGSDAQAIALADEVMEAMGGRQAWDQTRYIRWTFFGRRTLLWDKQTGNVRIDSPGDSSVYLVNVFDHTGKVMLQGQDISASDTLSKFVERGESMWINDSYWLVMPYKLKDSGVTLKYIAEDTTDAGTAADILSLTFQEVGRTPQNKYLVYVDQTSKLVSQWDFYRNAADTIAGFKNPWLNYEQKGDIMLSGDRGRGKLTNIEVLESIPASAFTSFDLPSTE